MTSSRSVQALSVAATVLLLAGCSSRSGIDSLTPAATGQASAAHKTAFVPNLPPPPPPPPPCPAGTNMNFVFIGDQSTGLINAYRPGYPSPGQPHCTIANPTTGYAPWGLAVDQNENLFAGYGDGSVWKFVPPSYILPTQKCAVSGLPYGLTADDQGNVFVGLFPSNSVMVCGPNTVMTDPNLTSIYTIAGAKFGPGYHLFAVGYTSSNVVEIDETNDGGATWMPRQVGGANAFCGSFHSPGGLAFGKATASGPEHLWYADGYNPNGSSCIYKFKAPYNGPSMLSVGGGVNKYHGVDTAIALLANDSIVFGANLANSAGRGARYHSNTGQEFALNPFTATQGNAYGIAVTPPSQI